MYGDKIKTIRELRGYSQEYLAGKLGIAQNTYSKIETNQTKLTAEILEKLSKELGVSPADILSHQPTIINFESNHGTQGIGNIEHFYSYQKELIEKILAPKESELLSLKQIIDSLLKDKERLMKFLEEKANHK